MGQVLHASATTTEAVRKGVSATARPRRKRLPPLPVSGSSSPHLRTAIAAKTDKAPTMNRSHPMGPLSHVVWRMLLSIDFPAVGEVKHRLFPGQRGALGRA
jgi:hypothetical protein